MQKPFSWISQILFVYFWLLVSKIHEFLIVIFLFKDHKLNSDHAQNRPHFVSKTVGTTNTTFAGIVLGQHTNPSSTSNSRDETSATMNRNLSQAMASNQLLTAALVAAATQQQQFQNEYQMQQQMLYTKPIGSERERPRSQQLGGGASSSGGSSSASSPTIQLHSGGNYRDAIRALTPTTPIHQSSEMSTSTTTTTSSRAGGMLLQSVNGLSLPSPGASTTTTASSKALTPPPGVTLNNGILSISNSRMSSQSMNKHQLVVNTNMSNTTTEATSSLVDLEKDKLIQDLKMQTEMSNKLESLCLQYRSVCTSFL